ncbi:hypothetical protein J6590_015820 [Homalodisca vitripennis]|nr:hypothetical protein J6590_015820 [Homalodisca vitripennis]
MRSLEKGQNMQQWAEGRAGRGHSLCTVFTEEQHQTPYVTDGPLWLEATQELNTSLKFTKSSVSPSVIMAQSNT